MATASELFEARHYPGVVALISDALEGEPDCVPLLLVRARAQMALRRDLDAQADLRDIIRLDPQCSLAYRLLGELAARRNENESAAIFFAEALRLDPSDIEADTWLAIVQATSRPAAAAQKLPAPAAAAGRFPSPSRTAHSTSCASVAHPRFAKGTSSPDDERPTARFTGQRAPLQAAALPREGSQASRLPQRARLATEPGIDGATHVPKRPGRPTERPVPPIGPDLPTDYEVEPLPPPPNMQAFAAGSSPALEAYRPVAGQTSPHTVARVQRAAPSQATQLPVPKASPAARTMAVRPLEPIAQPRHAGVFQAYPAESPERRSQQLIAHDSQEVTDPHSTHSRHARNVHETDSVDESSSVSHVETRSHHGAHAHADSHQATHAQSPNAYRRPPSQPSPSKPIARGSEPAVPRAQSAAMPMQTIPGAQPVRRPISAPSAQTARQAIPELPGFGDYLVSTGILTRERLRAAQAYQRSMKVQLATAIVTLGLATPQRIEWAAVAHQSQLSRGQ